MKKSEVKQPYQQKYNEIKKLYLRAKRSETEEEKEHWIEMREKEKLAIKNAK